MLLKFVFSKQCEAHIILWKAYFIALFVSILSPLLVCVSDWSLPILAPLTTVPSKDHLRNKCLMKHDSIYWVLATSCEELPHWKRRWCWKGLGVGGEGDDRGWDGWMASPTRWTRVWVNSRSWWWTGRPGVLQFMGSQRVRHNWATELNWITQGSSKLFYFYLFLLSQLNSCYI